MTVAVPGSGAVKKYDPAEFGGDTGLEDIEASDMTIPRLKIIHDEGVFKDSLSNTTHEKLTVVLLGLIKQRIMWAEEVDDGDMPMCKSPDHEHGFPNVDPDTPRDKQFPWAKSNFNASDARPLEIPPETSKTHPLGWTSNGLPVLTCAGCVFAKWEQGTKKPPPCSEQHTYPLLYSPNGDPSNLVPALLTIQKTGIKPSKLYLNSFALQGNPTFTAFTELSLVLQSRGTVKYSVPTFKNVGPTSRDDWAEFAARQRSIRLFLRSAPRNKDQEEAEEGAPPPASDNRNTAPTASPQPRPAEPAAAEASTLSATAAAAAATAPADDDDMPFF